MSYMLAVNRATARLSEDERKRFYASAEAIRSIVMLSGGLSGPLAVLWVAENVREAYMQIIEKGEA